MKLLESGLLVFMMGQLNQPLPLLLVEDDPQWQAACAALLATAPLPGYEVVGVAASSAQALALFEATFKVGQPYGVLLDWQLSDGPRGLEVGLAMVEAGLPASQIVLISGSSDEEIGPHPFGRVPKTRLANNLLPFLATMVQSLEAPSLAL